MRREKGTNRRLGWVIVPCTSKKALRTESHKSIEEILNTKLATILEEPDNYFEGNASHNTTTPKNNTTSNNNKKLWFKENKAKELVRSRFKRSGLLVSHNLFIKGSYIKFLAAFMPKGSLTGHSLVTTSAVSVGS